MKKSLLALSLTGLLFTACKKEKTVDFEATDVTGTTKIHGTCTKNIITPNGSGGWISTGRIPAAGVAVTVKINKNQLYPNSIAQGADTYGAVTDANGNYVINVKSNATGVTANITIDGFTGTLDTLINNVTKTGLYANYFGTSSNLNNVTIGQTRTFDHNFTATNLSTNPNNIIIGSAVITGSIGYQLPTKITTGTVVAIGGFTNVPVPAGQTVYMSFDKDPTTLAPKMYSTTTDATGKYTFTGISTVASGTSGFGQTASLWVADYATTRDTFVIVNNVNQSPITGPAGVFNQETNTQFSVFSNEIRNAVNMFYNNWTAN